MAWRSLQNRGVGEVSPPPFAPRQGAAAVSSDDGWSLVAARPNLTLVLDRAPDPLDPDITHLVTGGSIVFDLVATSAARIFVKDAVAQLCRETVSRGYATATGSLLRFTLSASLSAAEVREVLADLDEGGTCWSVDLSPGSSPQIVNVPLADLLAEAIDPLVRTVLVREPDGTLSPAPTLRTAPVARKVDRDAAAVPMVATAHGIASLELAMAPGNHASSAAALAASSAVQSLHVSPAIAAFVGADMIISGDDTAPDYQSAPLVTDAGASSWPDAAGGAGWYAPDLTIAQPAATDVAETAAFRFILTATGPVLGNGSAAQGLAAEIVFTLGATPPQGVDGAAVRDMARAVARDGLSCALELSYRQSGSTTAVTQQFPATVTDGGDRITASVTLLDDWVRLVYAALSRPDTSDGQTLPAVALVTTYSFFGYGRLPSIHVIGGGKLLQIAQVEDRIHLPANIDRPVFIAAERRLVTPHMMLSFEREAPGRAAPPPSAGRAIPLAMLSAKPTLQIMRPPAEPIIPIPRPRLVGRTFGRQVRTALAFPCNTFGSFYCERDGQGALKAFGCRDALRLGETTGKAFEEIEALRDPAYRVWRSLQQPGRFMAVPTAYRVGRYEPGDPGRAWRPTMLLSGELSSDPSQDTYQLCATLIADISAAQLALLKTRLATGYLPANTPLSLILPTDPFVGATMTTSWALPAEVASPATLPVLDTFVTTFSLKPGAALLVTTLLGRSGITGAVSFALADGTRLSSALLLDGIVVGPPSVGPVMATVAEGQATLVNKTASPVNVTALSLVDASGLATVLETGVSLDPGASSTVPLPAGTTANTCLAEARPAAATPIDELDLFVEDVTQTVHFINQLAFANHGLKALVVQARLKNSDHVETRDLPEGSTASIDFTLPITAYLETHSIEFSLVETPVSGAPISTGWREQLLDASSIIGITADLL